MPRIPFEVAPPPGRPGGGDRGVQLAPVPAPAQVSIGAATLPGRAMQQFGEDATRVAVAVGEAVVRAEGEEAFQRNLPAWLEQQDQIRQRTTARLAAPDADQRLDHSQLPGAFASEARAELDRFLEGIRNPVARSRLRGTAAQGIILATADVRRDSLRQLAGETEAGLVDVGERARIAIARGDANAPQLARLFEEQLGRARGVLDPVKLGNIRRGFLDGVAQDTILGAAQSDPVGTMRQIMQGGRFRDQRVQDAWNNLTPVARDRVTSRVRADANYMLTQASRAEAMGERAERRAGDQAQKDFEDAMRAGDDQAAAVALARLRRSASPAQYTSAADQYYGTPVNVRAADREALLQERLDDRANPLTPVELAQLRANRVINNQQFTTYSARVTARDNANFQRVEAYVRNALGAPGLDVPASLMSDAQRTARDNANRTINGLMRELVHNPQANLFEAADRLIGETVAPEVRVQAQRSRAAIERLPAPLRSREAIEALSQQLAAHTAYRNLPWMQRQRATTVPRPAVPGLGVPVDAAWIAAQLRAFEAIEAEERLNRR